MSEFAYVLCLREGRDNPLREYAFSICSKCNLRCFHPIEAPNLPKICVECFCAFTGDDIEKVTKILSHAYAEMTKAKTVIRAMDQEKSDQAFYFHGLPNGERVTD